MDDNSMSDGGSSTPNPITKTTHPKVDITNTTSTASVDTVETATGVTTPNMAPPATKSIPVTSPEPDNEETPTVPAESSTEPADTDEDKAADTIAPTAPAEPKKKRTSLIAVIIATVLVLIIGGGFAAFALIKNQPENIAAESFANLMNADKVAVSGEFSLTPKDSIASTIGPVTISLDTKTSDNNQSMNTVVTVSFPDQNQSYELGLGETMLRNGVLYIKASGLTKIYQEVMSPFIDVYLGAIANQNPNTSIYQDCYSIEDSDAYIECLEEAETDVISTGVDTTLVAELKTRVENIIKKIDDQWFEISLKDILENEMVSQYMDPSTKDTMLKSYDCVVDMLNKKPDYANEFSNLYQENKFAKITSSTDSYYKITLDDAKLANYLNKIPDTKLVSDFATCSNQNLNNNTSNISAEDVSNFTKYLPNIYAKFDGFLIHHLTALKIEQDTDYYNITSNLNITYPASLTISAPESSQPIMDLIEEIIKDIESVGETVSSI